MRLLRLECWTLAFCMGAFLVFGIATLGGCTEATGPGSVVPGAPPGAKVLKELGGDWKTWSLEDQCFLSRGLGFNAAVLTKIDCPKDSLK